MDGIKSESYKLHNIKNSKIVDYRIWIDLSLFKFNMLKFESPSIKKLMVNKLILTG